MGYTTFGDYTIYWNRVLGHGISSVVYEGINNITNVKVVLSGYSHSWASDVGMGLQSQRVAQPSDIGNLPLLDSEFIKNKIENFAHQEYNNKKYTDPDEIQKKIDGNLDLFSRDLSINSITQIEVYNNNYLPPLYDIYLKSFYKIVQINI